MEYLRYSHSEERFHKGQNMAVHAEWVDEGQTAIYLQLDGDIEEDFFAADIFLREMLLSLTYEVDVIADYSGQDYLSSHYVDALQKIDDSQRQNLRTLVFLGGEIAWELYNLYTYTFGEIADRCAYAADLDTAYNLVNAVRAGEEIYVQRPDFSDWNGFVAGIRKYQ
jgi:hypothetical protein